MVIGVYVLSLWGLCPQTPTRALPMDPLGTSVPWFCLPPKQISGYAPASNYIAYIVLKCR